ncbi:MAG: acetyl/propionyl/methylcrotonyl-CoA carboxylase subunit alpha [Alphaproteobacteria bacterium]|nr:acetyl/propionyl/methylcrotonyl-CoA carboxylase subunit alpha [Alphaproteobacteria bacterium]
MFKKILIANRGEIACRVMETAHRLGIETVVVYSDADASAKHVAMATEAYAIGPAQAAESYLDINRIIEACRASGAEAVHPGYGFLSENPTFVEAVEAEGLTFIGPSAEAIRAMGLKDAAKALMERAGVPVVPGYHGDDQDPDVLAERADEIGYPVLIKARAGGGGKGMRLVERASDFRAAFESAAREAEASFGDGRCLLEKYLASARHIEIQVFGDCHGQVVHLFERDCSLQRRHQKVIEEAPAPGMTDEMRAAMGEAAVRAAQAIDYVGAGTVEFIADVSDRLRSDRFYFMEMNTRLQVEHPVTEMIIGQDLVEWQFRVAAGGNLPLAQDELRIDGWAFEARVYAEDAAKGFLPATGRIAFLSFPDAEVRVDSGVRQGDEITPYYDPMIAKLVAHGSSREAARRRLSSALRQSLAVGVTTNIAFLAALTDHCRFASGDVDIGLIDRDLTALSAPPDPPIEATALAALRALGLFFGDRGREGGEYDPWTALEGWRLWSEARQVALLIGVDEARIEVDVAFEPSGRYHMRVLDEEVTIEAVGVDGDDVRMRTPDRSFQATVVRIGDSISVQMDGSVFSWTLPDPLARSAGPDAGGDRLLAPMPGLIKAVAASPGDPVTKDAPILVMEAMKMEHSLTAPRDGVIGDVFVDVGDQVQEGALLLELAEALDEQG